MIFRRNTSEAQTVEHRLDVLRTSIAALQGERAELRRQSRSRSEVEIDLARLVDEWFETGDKRHMSLTDAAAGYMTSPLRVEARMQSTSHALVDLGPLLTSLLGKDTVLNALLRNLDKVPHGVSATVKARRLAEIQNELDRIEREEESLIVQAELAGTDIARRHDARPEIVLAWGDSEGGEHD